MSDLATPFDRRPAGLLHNWLAELRTNRRALLGLFVIGALLAGEGFLLLRNATAQARAEYGRELIRLERIDAVAREHDWPRRARSSAALRATLENGLWPAESDGLARADLQGWIAGVAREIGLSTLDVRIELATPKNLPPDLRQITASITAQPSEAALVELLRRVDQAPHLLVVERLDVKQVPSPFLDMTLTAYARIGPKPAKASPPAGVPSGEPQ